MSHYRVHYFETVLETSMLTISINKELRISFMDITSSNCEIFMSFLLKTNARITSHKTDATHDTMQGVD